MQLRVNVRWPHSPRFRPDASHADRIFPLMKIAVIGSGIAGNSAAYALSQGSPHQVTVFEAEDRIGGHSATVDIDYGGQPIAVDTGFIVYNTLNYPNLTAMFAHLGVETQASDMSFSVSIGRGDFEWVGRTRDVFQGLFAQRRNILNPRYLGMLLEILRFQKESSKALAEDRLGGLSLGDLIRKGRFSDYFKNRYILPMGAAIWSTPAENMLDFPAENFVAFFENHRLLHWERPVWRTVTGGSRRYVEKLTAPFKDHIRSGDPVVYVTRTSDGAVVTTKQGRTEVFDHVIAASHPDETLAFLKDATAAEQQVLSAITYRPNAVYLHRDAALMPKRREAWAAWNFLRESDASTGDVCVSYSMQHLQGIDPACPLFVTLNPPVTPQADKVFRTFTYAHPQFTQAAFSAQKALRGFNGQNRIHFAGAWMGYGFHEDGLVAGLDAAEALGAEIAWRPKSLDPKALAPTGLSAGQVAI
jgi:uncharacterized protein